LERLRHGQRTEKMAAIPHRPIGVAMLTGFVPPELVIGAAS
jgi:hypothetical protein